MTERLSDITCTDVNIKTHNRDKGRYTNIMRINDKTFIKCRDNQVTISPIQHATFNGTVDFTGAAITGLTYPGSYDDTYLINLINQKADILNPVFSNRVGINSNSPSVPLDVLGDASISGTVRVGNLIGSGSGLTSLGSIDTHSDVDTTTNYPNPGDALIWDASTNNWIPGYQIYRLDDMTDVNVFPSTPNTVGDVLTWNGAAWSPAAIPYNVNVINDLNDVSIGTLTNEDELYWDTVTSRWKNRQPIWTRNTNPGIEYSSGIVTLGGNLYLDTQTVLSIQNPTMNPNDILKQYIGRDYSNNNGFFLKYNHISNSDANNYLQISHNGSTATQGIVIASTGNVGIGSTTPSEIFDVDGTAKIVTLKCDGLTSQHVLNGGGLVEFSNVGGAHYIKWNRSITALPISRNYSSSFAIFIDSPVSGDVIAYNTSGTTATVTADGIPMNPSDALYYINVPGLPSSPSDITRLRLVAGYDNTFIPDSNWILICVFNDLSTSLKWLPGEVVIPSGNTFDTSTGGLKSYIASENVSVGTGARQENATNMLTLMNTGTIAAGTMNMIIGKQFSVRDSFYLKYTHVSDGDNSNSLTIEPWGATGATWTIDATCSVVQSGGVTAAGTLLTFTGQHINHVKDIDARHADIYQGLIVSANSNEYMKLNGVCRGLQAITINESLPVLSLSRKVKDKSVFGVISSSEIISEGNERLQENGAMTIKAYKEVGDYRVIVNSVGEGAIWIIDKGEPLESGDFITSSNVPGYGQKQDNEYLTNYTVAKITMDCDFNPKRKNVKIVKKNNGENILDENGNIQWEDSDELEDEYRLMYVHENGDIVSKFEYDTFTPGTVFRAAFVGCTYHCG